MKNHTFLLLIVLILIGISTRFIFISGGESSFPNFTAIGAIALFGANYFKGASRFILPLAVLWVSDLILNNIIYSQYYDSFQVVGSMWVYAAFLLTVVIGIFIMRKPSWKKLILGCLGSGIIFFLITNFAVWLSPGTPYTKDFAGMLNCYLMALPFFRNTLLGNFFYAFVLFGACEFALKYWMNLKSDRTLGGI